MRNKIASITLACLTLFSFSVAAQKKVDGKILKEVKEWRVDGNKKRLDHITKYDEKGNKSEEIEYSSVGDQKSRVTYKYNERNKCIEERHFDEYNKLEKVVTFEYGENGKKASQKTTLPNGKLKGQKVFEYVLE